MDFEDDDETWMTQAAEAAENDELCRTTQALMSNATELPRTATYMSDSQSTSIKQRLTSATMRVSQLEADLKKKKEESDTHSRLYLSEKRKCSDLERQIRELKNAHNAEVEMLNAQLAEDWRRLAVREKLAESKGINDKQDTGAGFSAVDHRPFNPASAAATIMSDAVPQQKAPFNDSDVKVRPISDVSGGATCVNHEQMQRRSVSFGTTGDTMLMKRRDEVQIEVEHDAEDVVRCLFDDFSQLVSVRNAESDMDADNMVQTSGRFVSRLASGLLDSANGVQFSRLFEMLKELAMALETVFLRASDANSELAHVNVVCLMRASVALLQSAMCTQIRCKCDVQTQLVIASVMARQFDVLRVGLLRFGASTAGQERRPVAQLLHAGLQIASHCLTFCATRMSNVAALSTVQRALLVVEKPTEQTDTNPNVKFSRSSSTSQQSQIASCCFVCWSCTSFRAELRDHEPTSCDERYSLVRYFGQFANGLLGLVSSLRLRNVHLPRACRWPSVLLKALVSALSWLRAAERTMQAALENVASNVQTTSVRNDEFQLIALTLRSCVNDDYLRREVGRIQLLDPIEVAQASSDDSSAHNFVNACYSLLEQEAIGDRLAEAALRKFCSARARSNN